MIDLAVVLYVIFVLASVGVIVSLAFRNVKAVWAFAPFWFGSAVSAAIVGLLGIQLSVSVLPELPTDYGNLTKGLYNMFPSFFVVILPSSVVFLLWKRRRTKMEF